MNSLVHWDPYNGLLESLFNWVISIVPYIDQITGDLISAQVILEL